MTNMWDLATGTCTATLVGHTRAVVALDLFPATQLALSGDLAGEICVWDLELCRCKAIWSTDDTHPVLAVKVLPCGKKAVTCGYRLRVWDLERGTCTAAMDHKVHDVRLMDDGQRAVTLCLGDDTLRVCDLQAYRCTAVMELWPTNEAWLPNTSAWTAHGNVAVCALHGAPARLKVWDLATASCTWEWSLLHLGVEP